MTPLFTIIIPVYNVTSYLKKCIDSVLKQTYSSLECICIDDGSTDGGGVILDKYAAKDSRVRVLHQANAGVSVARNEGLRIAQGEWVQFLDGDDSLETDFLEKLHKAVVEHPDVDAIEHTAIYCYNDGTRVYGDKGVLPPSCVVDASEIRRDPWGRKYTSLGRCSCYKIFRRSVIVENGLRFTPGIPLGEDSLFAGQFYAYAGKIAICPEVAGYLRIFRSDSAMHEITAKRLIPKIRGCEALLETWEVCPSDGFDVWVAASVLSTSMLGREQGGVIRAECIMALLNFSFFCKKAMPFLLSHGTWKARLFAGAYLISPRILKRKILEFL